MWRRLADLLQARAVVDELLPPAFLGDRYRLHFGGIGGMQVLKKAQKWLCEQPGKAASERFRKVCVGTSAGGGRCLAVLNS